LSAVNPVATPRSAFQMGEQLFALHSQRFVVANRHGGPMNANLKTILISVLVATFAVFAYSQVTNYLDAKKAIEIEFKDAKKLVASSSAYAENVLKLENEDSNITFKELFDKISTAIEESDKAIVFVKSSAVDDSWKSASVAYLEASQETLRAMKSKYQKALDFSSHLDFAKEQLEDYKNSPYNEYTNSSDIRRLRKYSEEIDEKKSELTAAELEFFNSIKKLSGVSKENSARIGSDIMINSMLIEKIIAKITPQPSK
jgi:hypothetical protein